MSYGLVRQVGPWPLTPSDLKKVLAPAPTDPTDYQVIRPGIVRAGNTQPLAKSAMAMPTVMLPPADDPRVQAVGRRLGINRVLGGKREPLEGQGMLSALTGGGSLQLKLDPVTGEVISDKPSLLTKTSDEMKKEPLVKTPQAPLPKRKMTPEEMGASVINGFADVIPYMIPFLF
jgi:hypothetical protein